MATSRKLFHGRRDEGQMGLVGIIIIRSLNDGGQCEREKHWGRWQSRRCMLLLWKKKKQDKNDDDEM